MGDPSFAPHPNIPRTAYLFLPSGWLWKYNLKVDSTGKFILKDSAGLMIKSRGPIQVPNSESVFKGHLSNDKDRTVEFFALTDGITMLDVTDPKGAKPDEVIMSLQVEVLKTPDKKFNFVVFDGDACAINSSDTPVPYKLKTTLRISGGPPENIFDGVPKDTKHVAISCHGQMHPTMADMRAGKSDRFFELLIGGNVTGDEKGGGNVEAVFGKLKSKCEGGVVWIGGCEAGASLEFCKRAAKASGCYIVASSITLPPAKPNDGEIEFFPNNMIKFFNKDGSGVMSKADFMTKAKELKFHIRVS